MADEKKISRRAIEELQETPPQYTEPYGAGDKEATVEIDMVELMYRLLENLKYIIVIALIGAAIAGFYTTRFITPMYQATSKIYVVNSKDSAINLSDLQIGSYLTNDYQEVFKTWEVHEQVLSNLGLNYSYSKMQSMLSVSNPNNTRILNITVKSADANEAALIANEYAEVAKQYIARSMATEKPNILSEALVPSSPVSPNLPQNIIMGFMLGALFTIGIVVLYFLLDDKIKSPEDIRKYIGIPTLAVIHQIQDLKPENTTHSSRSKGDKVVETH